MCYNIFAVDVINMENLKEFYKDDPLSRELNKHTYKIPVEIEI